MNIEEARDALMLFDPLTIDQHRAREALVRFIIEVELLLKNNSIKQTPALFKPFDKGG